MRALRGEVSALRPGGVRTNLREGIRFSKTVDDPENFGGSEEFGPQSVEPDEVARLVLDAAETRGFMILTDPRLHTMLVRKAENIQAYLDMRAASGAQVCGATTHLVPLWRYRHDP